MIVTTIDPFRLVMFQALIQAGATPTQIRKAMRIRRTTYYAYRAELRRLEDAGRTLQSELDPPSRRDP